ncbi:Membrane protein involved in the export of O-antigen and teichoic acid [Lachnospiraceae bacterium TWA4]|nr:Membrane protein involved in the export of O-antigen and teichoic acid [Lachnospiraceae bacterium TWA4]
MKVKINQLKAGTILSYINLGLGCIIPLLYTPIMLRMLGKENYGVYSLASSVISYLSLLTFGMGSACIRYIVKYKTEGNKDGVEKVAGLFVLIYSVLAILVLIVGFNLSFLSNILFSEGLTIDETEQLKILIIIMTISTAISFPTSAFSSICGSYERYVFQRLLDIFGTIMVPIFNLITLFIWKSTIGLAGVGLLIAVINCISYFIYSVRKLDIHVQFHDFHPGLLREIWEYSAFVFLSSIVDLLYWSTDKVLIGARIGSAAVAVYNMGNVFTSMLQNMSAAISSVFAPRVTSMVVLKNDSNEISDLLIRVGRVQYIVVSFILSGYIVFGEQFIHFWAGDEYADAYFIALLTMIPLAIPLIQNIAFTTILAQKKHQFRSIIYLIIAIINIISTYLVLPIYGIIGAAVCTGIAFLLGNGLIMNIYYIKITKLRILDFWKNISSMTVVPVIVVVVGYILTNQILGYQSIFMFLIEVIIYSIVHLGLTWTISMNQYERNTFLGIIKKPIELWKNK